MKIIFINNLFWALTFCIVLIITGCEGYECSQGIVLDSTTKKPIDSVRCVSNGGDEVITNSQGRFEELCSPFGGCKLVDRNWKLNLQKWFINKVEKDKFDTVYLEKSDTVEIQLVKNK
jgi:hypothetical protein